MRLNKINIINLNINFKQIILFEKCLIYSQNLNIFQINYFNKSHFSIPLKIYYTIKKIVIDTHYKILIIIDTLNQILFIQRPLFIIAHIIKSKDQPINVYISQNNKLLSLIYKNFIELWKNQKKFSISIQKLRKIKINIINWIQIETSHDLKHTAILDVRYLVTIITIECKSVKIQTLKNYNIIFIKQLFLHYLLLFINKKKILTFIRILIIILDNKHILYWYLTKYKIISKYKKTLKIIHNKKKWFLRKKYYLLNKERNITHVIVNVQKSLIVILYERNMIFIFSIINLKLFLKLLFKNHKFFYLKTKKNMIFLCNFLTHDCIIINISLKKIIFIFTNEQNPINSYSICKDCSYILIAFQKSFIRLGELKKLQLLIILLNITSIIKHLFFLNKSNFFVISSGFKNIQIFCFLNFKLHKILYLPKNCYFNIILSNKNDNYLAGVCDNTKVLLWSIKTCLLIRIFSFHCSKITTFLIIEKNMKIITGSLDKTIKIFKFNIETKNLISLKHEYFILDLNYDFLNNCIFSLTENNYLYIWQNNTGYLKKIINLKLLIQKININVAKFFKYKIESIKKFYYIKKHLLLFSILKIMILFFSNSIIENTISGVLNYDLLEKEKKESSYKYTNKKYSILGNYQKIKTFSIFENRNKIFFIHKTFSEIILFKLNLTLPIKKYIKKNYKKSLNMKKYLKDNSIFLISEILFSFNNIKIKNLLLEISYLEIDSLIFILIFNILIVLKFKYTYINLLV
uniref:Uncharacterized protein n=1 Tax=Lotharella vacuolata TaxID=74820 RepID=A0A0H5BKV8_9EUKA|nr:hypothetical protein [Lotharella vacuolata]